MSQIATMTDMPAMNTDAGVLKLNMPDPQTEMEGPSMDMGMKETMEMAPAHEEPMAPSMAESRTLLVVPVLLCSKLTVLNLVR